ncbi:MAG TPA: hypothetical protein VFW03_02950 [Gemmatimonadaceae bacterium]|nr:hypothetical protein [Gemmatimonadaceae bacterium]
MHDSSFTVLLYCSGTGPIRGPRSAALLRDSAIDSLRNASGAGRVHWTFEAWLADALRAVGAALGGTGGRR